MDRRREPLRPERHREALDLAGEIFSSAGWKVHAGGAPPPADLLLRRGSHSYAARLRASAESRRDRLIPLLAAAILESRAGAWASSAKPLALVCAAHLSESLIQDLLDYARRVAPDAAVGLLDLEGRVEMRGPRLEELRGRPQRRVPARPANPSHQPFDPFSDLNQWMLKVLLARRLPADLLAAPRADAANAPELARVAQASAASAYRLVRHLSGQGLLSEVAPLQLVRVPELLRQWSAAYVRPPRDIRMRWLIPGKRDQILRALQRYEASRRVHHPRPDPRRADRRPGACLALFSAADILGLGHVRGVPDHIYLERPDVSALDAIGLVRANPNEPVHVVVRIPQWPRSVFQGAVDRDGIPVSDILQVWLDVSEHPARGAEQADEIWRQVLRRAFEPDAAA